MTPSSLISTRLRVEAACFITSQPAELRVRARAATPPNATIEKRELVHEQAGRPPEGDAQTPEFIRASKAGYSRRRVKRFVGRTEGVRLSHRVADCRARVPVALWIAS